MCCNITQVQSSLTGKVRPRLLSHTRCPFEHQSRSLTFTSPDLQLSARFFLCTSPLKKFMTTHPYPSAQTSYLPVHFFWDEPLCLPPFAKLVILTSVTCSDARVSGPYRASIGCRRMRPCRQRISELGVRFEPSTARALMFAHTC